MIVPVYTGPKCRKVTKKYRLRGVESVAGESVMQGGKAPDIQCKLNIRCEKSGVRI